MNGMGGGKFSPNGDMTRGMAITILYRLDGEPEVKGENVFTDVKEGVYYADAANWGSQNGVVNGVGGGKFEPEGKVTREQFAAMVSRYMSYKKVPASEGETISFLDANDISSYAK